MKYFTLEELTRSETAVKKGIANNPDEDCKKNLVRLIDNVLDPLREAYGAPIHVNSGFRCQKLNKAVGGSKTSEHVYGMAADITAIDGNEKKRRENNQRLFELCISLGLPFHQLIDEKNFRWVHVSFNPYTDLQREIKHL